MLSVVKEDEVLDLTPKPKVVLQEHYYYNPNVRLAAFLYLNTVNAMPAKVAMVTTNNGSKEETALEFYNYRGRLLSRAPLSSIAELHSPETLWSDCFGKYVRIHWTDEAYETRRKRAGKIFRYLAKRHVCVPLSQHAERLVQDYQNKHSKTAEMV